MKRLLLLTACSVLQAAAAGPVAAAPPADTAASSQAGRISEDAQTALARLYADNTKARELGGRARAVLIFPRIVKAGLMVGGQSGDGALIENGRTVQFYNISAASFGFQAGAQTFSYALFFITDTALDYLKKSKGWSVGSGPSVVIVDKGFAKSLTTTTLTQDVYAIPFGQHGLMAGAGLEGSKISQIYPAP